MNEITGPTMMPRTTQAAEGLPRWRWTTAELIRLTELGVLRAEDKFAQIGGEIVPMSPTERRHEVVREELERMLRDRRAGDIRVVAALQFNLADDTYCEPDILVRPAAIKTYDLRGPDALLVIEIAATSLDYELESKAALYASHGVREYWVVDAATLATSVHRDSRADGYASKVEVPATDLLTPHLEPALAVRLADLDLD
jgi:Uma2 family endonuclease